MRWVEGDLLARLAVRSRHCAGDSQEMRGCNSRDGNCVGHEDFEFSRKEASRSDDLCALKPSEHSALQRTMRNCSRDGEECETHGDDNNATV